MANKQICAVDIKRLWFGDFLGKNEAAGEIETWRQSHNINAGRGAVETTSVFSLANLIPSWLENAEEIKNVHQDTWSLEEAEASQDSYRNQLTQQIYRFGRKQNGDLTVKFTIGQYDYRLKQKFLGGYLVKEVAGENETIVGWERSPEPVEIKGAFLALTIDDQYCFIPYASVVANEADADKAVGIGVQGTAQSHPDYPWLPVQGWYDSSAIKEKVG